MQIENLPYPVYCEGSPDYNNVLFSAEIDQVESSDPLYFTVKGRFNIKNQDIEFLLNSNAAGYGVFIECDQTNYCELRQCAPHFQENLIKAYFTDIVTVTPVIYAKKEISHYRNAELIEELRGQDITIPEGGIIAADGDLELTIARSQPQTVESICKFKPQVAPSYDLDGESIVLYVPEEVYNSYRSMGRLQKIQVTSIYFPPVLQSIIAECFSGDGSEYQHRRWYQAVKDSLYANGVDPVRTDPYNAMMAVLNGLLAEGVSYIPRNKEVTE